MARDKGGKAQDRDHGNKARDYNKAVDKTEKRINEANKSGKSADEKLRDLLKDD